MLFQNPDAASAQLAELTGLIDRRSAVLQEEVSAFYQLRARQLGVAAVAYVPSAADNEAASTTVQRVPGGRFFGRKGRNDALFASVPARDRPGIIAAYERLPQHMAAELSVLISQGKTVLEIRDFLAGEFDPISSADLLEYLRATEKIGGVKLVISK